MADPRMQRGKHPERRIPKTRFRIVPYSKRERERAKLLLARIKPLDEWLATAGDEALESVRRQFGDPAIMYHLIVSELEKVASGQAAAGAVWERAENRRKTGGK